MALAAGLHGYVRRDLSRPGKIDNFGVNFKGKILVCSDVLRPFKRIVGKIDIETRFQIKHKGIFIQFEGMCMLRYTSKLGNQTTFHQGRNCLVSNVKPDRDGFQKSPIRQIILPVPESNPYIINHGSETYPFALEIPGDPHLPAPFKTSLGCLVYRLVVYMQSTKDSFVEIAEQVMRFNGHHNLLGNVEAMKPVTLDNFYKKSSFSRKKMVEIKFSIETSGCLPGESIPFVFYARNPKSIPLQITLELKQVLKYDASGRRDSPKKRFAILAIKEKDDFEPQPELNWVGSMEMPENLEPTFTAHSMYNVTYLLQYKVKILDYGTIRGETPFFIGTTRDPAQVLRADASALDITFIGLARRGSAASTHSVRSHNSVTTTYSLPPAYSQLSSRIPSLETLPPTYDEIEFLEDTQGEEREEVNLEVPNVGDGNTEENDSDSN